MALYSLEDFKKLVLSTNWQYLNEARSFRTLDKLNWTSDNLVQMLAAMHQDDFQKTVKNCEIRDFTGQRFVDADMYEVHWDEDAGISRPYSTDNTVSFSLKIAIMENAEGQLAGVVTFHLSGSPW